jgi:hypothetical protein
MKEIEAVTEYLSLVLPLGLQALPGMRPTKASHEDWWDFVIRRCRSIRATASCRSAF